uniref:Pre-mRNA-processing factor 19 n=1 Tax=Cacopsylla melanoneura TaxID=428564 RepID=A0A8D8R9D0_9HEMI
MSLVCALSNEVPEHPVVSPISGSVFERRLIEKYIKENGTDPITPERLTLEQLIDIKVPPVTKPKPPQATSIPAILKMLQDEWDAIMLHSFTQRQQLQTARQELSHALYQHDAACRVIARLTKEVTAAREALATLKPQAAVAAPTSIPQPAIAAEAAGVAHTPAPSTPVEQMGISEAVQTKLQDKATILTQERKKRSRAAPEDLSDPDQIRGFRNVASQAGLHSASVPGILAMDIQVDDTSKILTGGNDCQATVFNKDTEQVVAILKGHRKKVTRVVYHPSEDIVITGSPDTHIRVWDVGTSQTMQLMAFHSGPITGLSIHPTGDYILSTGEDQTWAFSDLRSGRLLTQVSASGQGGPTLTTAQLHPDGLIFGIGTSDSQVQIWDLKKQKNVTDFQLDAGPIQALSFSENGYYLATAADENCVKLWDLRKLKNFKTIQLDPGYEIRDLCFDHSGTYMAVAGTDVRVFLCKQWQELANFNDHTAMVTGVRFGAHAHYLASSSMDRTLKLYSM